MLESWPAAGQVAGVESNDLATPTRYRDLRRLHVAAWQQYLALFALGRRAAAARRLETLR